MNSAAAERCSPVASPAGRTSVRRRGVRALGQEV